MVPSYSSGYSSAPQAKPQQTVRFAGVSAFDPSSHILAVSALPRLLSLSVVVLLSLFSSFEGKRSGLP
jgi:hypothetical protein